MQEESDEESVSELQLEKLGLELERWLGLELVRWLEFELEDSSLDYLIQLALQWWE